MRAKPEEWTVVLVGQWNPAIFNPEWVGRNLNNGQPVMTEIATGPAFVGIAGWRVIVGDLVLVPGIDRLTLGTRATTDDGLRRMEAAARTILELLPHTPLLAFGINFGFLEEAPEAELLRLFQGGDLPRLTGGGYEVTRHEIKRSLTLGREILNAQIALEGGAVTASMNYHHDLTGGQPGARPTDARAALEGRVVQARDQAIEILRIGYGLELTDEEA